MRFFIGKHYRDTKVRDGDEVYVGSALHPDAGNLVNIRTGAVYFMEDNVLYQYEVDARAENCFDATPVHGDATRFVPVDVNLSYESNEQGDGG